MNVIRWHIKANAYDLDSRQKLNNRHAVSRMDRIEDDGDSDDNNEVYVFNFYFHSFVNCFASTFCSTRRKANDKILYTLNCTINVYAKSAKEMAKRREGIEEAEV